MITFPLDSLIIGKNEEYGYPIVDRPYTAEQLREVYKTFFSNGVFMNEQDAFQVTPGDGMNVIVSPGKCLIEGAVGYEKAQRQLAVQAASTTADRIDTVVLRLNLNVEVRNIDLYVKTGTAQDVPVRPTLTRSESVWELGIGDLFIAKNTGAISSARITDTRLQTDRCGAVTPFATIDTTTFFNQIQAAIDENVATLQEQTQVAVELAQSAIDGTTAGNLQNQITANKEAIEENKATDDERWDSLSITEATGSLNYGWSGFINLTKSGHVVTMHMNLAFQSLALFDGAYATIPDGFRPRFGMMNVPCMLSNGASMLNGSMGIGIDGAISLNSFGTQVNQAFATVAWMVD